MEEQRIATVNYGPGQLGLSFLVDEAWREHPTDVHMDMPYGDLRRYLTGMIPQEVVAGDFWLRYGLKEHLSYLLGIENDEKDVVFSSCRTNGSSAIMGVLNALFPPQFRHPVTSKEIHRWRDNSLATFRAIVSDERALEAVVSCSDWYLSLDRSPSDVWYGEDTFILTDAERKHRPRVIIYHHSLTAALPQPFFDLAGQSGMDHLVGHLYAYHAGEPDFGEEVACKYQYLAARSRGGLIGRAIAGAVAVLQRLHKDIPLSNYRSL